MPASAEIKLFTYLYFGAEICDQWGEKSSAEPGQRRRMPNIFLNLDYLTVLTSSLKQASIITSFEHCLYPRGRCLYISDKLMICALLQSGPSGKVEVYDYASLGPTIVSKLFLHDIRKISPKIVSRICWMKIERLFCKVLLIDLCKL